MLSGIDILLIALKVLGILGAYLGFNKLAQSATADGRPPARLRTVIPMLFLTVAVAAEVTDAAKKAAAGQRNSDQANELRHQIDRLQNPLSAVFTPFYAARIENTDGYALRLERWRQQREIDARAPAVPVPGPSEPQARAVLDSTLEATVFLYKDGTGAHDREPDISFELTEQTRQRMTPPGGLEGFMVTYPKDRLARRIRASGSFSGKGCLPPWLCFDEPPTTLTAASRVYTKRTILAQQDLVGAQMDIRVCPEPPLDAWQTAEERQALKARLELKLLVIEFGVGETMQISTTSQEGREGNTLTEIPSRRGSTDECRAYAYQFPASMERLRAAFNP